MKQLLSILSLLWLSLGAMADEGLSFSYASQDIPASYWGTKKAETYDVAIRIASGSFAGKKVKGIRVPFLASQGVRDVKAWASSKLQLATIDGKKTNQPDLASTEGEAKDGMLQAFFAEPVTIPEDGIYVGYTLTVDQPESYASIPIAVCGGVTHNDGFYIHTSRTYLKWTGRSSELQCVLYMSVIMEGDFAEDMVSIVNMDDIHAERGDTAYVKARLKTMGSRPVERLTYHYQAGDTVGTASFTLPEPIPAVYGMEQDVRLPLQLFNSKMNVPFSLTLTHVNGHANGISDQTVYSHLGIHPFIPVHRPLCEEYSGLWCGYCPSGFAMMEEMTKRYPERFIGVSFHSSDIIQSIPANRFPSNVPYYPSLWVDRYLFTDPYFGEDMGIALGFEKTWLKETERFVPADISVEAMFLPDRQNEVCVKASVSSAVDSTEANFRIGYMLLANDLHGNTKDWAQINNYSGDEKYAGLPGLDYFVNSREVLIDLHHNHVIVAASSFDGVDGSLPMSLSEEANYTHSYTFDTDKALCVYGDSTGRPIIQDKGKLTAIAYIVDANGVIVNAAKAPVIGFDTAIESIQAMPENRNAVCYDLQGRRLSQSPRHGICLRRQSDGRIVKVCSRP